MRKTILSTQSHQMNVSISGFETRLESLKGPIISLGQYSSTRHLIRKDYENYSPKWMQCRRDLDEYLKNINAFTDYIVDVNILSADSETVYSMSDILRSEYDYKDQVWFKKALEEESVVKYAAPHGLLHMYPGHNLLTFTVIYPIKNNISVEGYVLFECNLLRMADFLNYRINPDAGYFMMDESGSIIYGYRDLNDDSELLFLQSSFKQGVNTLQKDGHFYQLKQIKDTNWVAVWETDVRQIMDPLRKVGFTIVGVVVLIIIISIIINIFTTKKLEKPLRKLLLRIQSYDGTGSVDIEENENAPMELVVIRRQFEKMADKVNGLIQDVYFAELKQKEAELEALMNQINPHFLYNVFQLIQTKAVISDNYEIEDMIQALSMMMRYAMERKPEKVPVERELEYIKNYLMFYKERFPTKFEYEIIYDKKVTEYGVLRFALQPVVENCFKHGILDMKSGGYICIRIEKQDDFLVFYVEDNAGGMTPERLKYVQEKLKKQDDDRGIGIVNTHTRLKLAYGKDCGLSISSKENEKTVVTIKIKKEEV